MKKSSKIKSSNNSFFFVLIFANSKFRNTGRSPFRCSKFCHPVFGVKYVNADISLSGWTDNFKLCSGLNFFLSTRNFVYKWRVVTEWFFFVFLTKDIKQKYCCWASKRWVVTTIAEETRYGSRSRKDLLF